MPAHLFALPSSAVTLSALFSTEHPFGAGSLAIAFIVIFLGALGLMMWVGRLRDRKRAPRRDPR